MIHKRGHGTGHKNSRQWNYKFQSLSCEVYGKEHDWHTYKKDPTQEFCCKCGKFRINIKKKGGSEMSEDIKIIITYLQSINKKLEEHLELNKALLEALQPHREYAEEPKKKAPIKKLPKSTKKIAPGTHRIASKPCNKCGGLISWDGYDKSNPTPPLHVDENGYLVGNGRCPAWEEDDFE